MFFGDDFEFDIGSKKTEQQPTEQQILYIPMQHNNQWYLAQQQLLFQTPSQFASTQQAADICKNILLHYYVNKQYQQICTLLANASLLPHDTVAYILLCDIQVAIASKKQVPFVIWREIWETSIRSMIHVAEFHNMCIAKIEQIEVHVCGMVNKQELLDANAILELVTNTSKQHNRINSKTRVNMLVQCWQWRAQVHLQQQNAKQALYYLQRMLVCCHVGAQQAGSKFGLPQVFGATLRSVAFWKLVQQAYEMLNSNTIAQIASSKVNKLRKIHLADWPAQGKVYEQLLSATSSDIVTIINDAVEHQFLQLLQVKMKQLTNNSKLDTTVEAADGSDAKDVPKTFDVLKM